MRKTPGFLNQTQVLQNTILRCERSPSELSDPLTITERFQYNKLLCGQIKIAVNIKKLFFFKFANLITLTFLEQKIQVNTG